MKVELGGLSAIQGSVERSTNQATAASTPESQSIAADRTTFHSGSMEALVGTALSTPEVRQDKVDAARQAISSGEYQIDPARIAAGIISDGH